MGKSRKASKAVLKRQQNKSKRQQKLNKVKSRIDQKVQDEINKKNGVKSELSPEEEKRAKDFSNTYRMTGKIPGQEKQLPNHDIKKIKTMKR